MATSLKETRDAWKKTGISAAQTGYTTAAPATNLTKSSGGLIKQSATPTQNSTKSTTTSLARVPTNDSKSKGSALTPKTPAPKSTAAFTPTPKSTAAATPKAPSSFDDTVQGQLNSILAKDGELMQRARSLAMQQMNERGLINSSLAAGAGTTAMIDAASNIASRDAQMKFDAKQAELERAQQTSIANLQLKAQKDLQTMQQGFAATQAQLDREQQTKMVELQNSLANSNVSTGFATNVATGTLNQINAISADGNLTPESKKAAIDNIIGAANSTMQWGSTFYRTPLPPMTSPTAPAPATTTPTAPVINTTTASSGSVERAYTPEQLGVRY